MRIRRYLLRFFFFSLYTTLHTILEILATRIPLIVADPPQGYTCIRLTIVFFFFNAPYLSCYLLHGHLPCLVLVESYDTIWQL